jgi:hypothetical protein
MDRGGAQASSFFFFVQKDIIAVRQMGKEMREVYKKKKIGAHVSPAPNLAGTAGGPELGLGRRTEKPQWRGRKCVVDIGVLRVSWSGLLVGNMPDRVVN